MATNRHIDAVCLAAAILSLLLVFACLNGEALGLQSADPSLGYETRLLDPERVHTLDLVMDDWEGFLETCESEEYVSCSVVIDGEAYRNVAIRAKGNTSLSSVSSMGSQRYSFKVEFDHYESGKTYHGLDKLCLNNIIQDNTYMKDYLVYRAMADYGVDAPLCSFAYLTVNGEDWGLYLAVEGVEDAFLKRNYGSASGELYKPDSTSFGGGGPGNGRNFRMTDFFDNADTETGTQENDTGNTAGFPARPTFADGGGRMRGNRSGGGFPNFGGMGSDDVKLQYIDDNPDSYSNIFDNAKTDVTAADKTRLIAALKRLGEGEDLENTVDTEEVIRYFAVHNFVCNGDSYTGSIIHNYYLHEKDGRLSMIPWDYNLAFGTFQGADASSMVNDPIDTPMSVSDPADRPMMGWIVRNEEYKALYHAALAEFMDTVDMAGLAEETRAMIAAYVEKDPTAFCTYEAFEAGVTALETFCELRAESVRGQIDGTIPSTADGQAADASGLVDASSVTISDMGSMGNGRGGGMRGGERGNMEIARMGNAVEESQSGEEIPRAREMESPEAPDGDSEAGETLPDGAFPEWDGNPPDFGGFGGNAPDMESVESGADNWILLGVSIAVLLVGLVIAFKYRERIL